MCGFLGTIQNSSIDLNTVNYANRDIICRGPDNRTQITGKTDTELGLETSLNFSFTFNRLSIIDLSEKANQPMVSKKHNNLIMFNGEIYNHAFLKKQLINDGATFQTDHSDTEVLLNGFTMYGTQFVQRIVGQFAIFFLNKRTEKAYLIRDRLGQKPLFYYKDKDKLLFGSNLRSLVKLLGGSRVSDNSIYEYLNLGVVTSPNTIFENIYKVEPSQIIEFDLKKLDSILKNYYWSLENYYDNNLFDEGVFYDLLIDSIKLRNVSDVPIANFLSGGIDSTLIAKLQMEINDTVNTFTVGYEDKKYDETKWSDLVANKYSTNHIVEHLNSKEIVNLVDESMEIFDEPYSDPSIVPSYSISKLIAQNYKVAISGDGGDELAFGYDRTRNVMNSLNINESVINYVFNLYPSYFGSGAKILQNSKNKSVAYSSYFEDKKLLEILNIKYNSDFLTKFTIDNHSNYKNFMFTEYKFYLMEQMMLKVDRTSMANSLEVRSPFVDHRLLEYMLSVDEQSYISKSQKQILKNILSKDFDSSFLNRKKMGFVFNVEKYTEENKNIIQETLFNGNHLFQQNKKQIEKLFDYNSRFNALRCWKMYTLQRYLNSIN